MLLRVFVLKGYVILYARLFIFVLYFIVMPVRFDS